MKMNKLLGLLVCTALCACSNDESGIIPNDTPNVFTGDKAYIKVRLADAGTLTRAQEGDFEYGTNEQSIKNASFYFYDADGVFVTQGRMAAPRRQPLPKTSNLRATILLC